MQLFLKNLKKSSMFHQGWENMKATFNKLKKQSNKLKALSINSLIRYYSSKPKDISRGSKSFSILHFSSSNQHLHLSKFSSRKILWFLSKASNWLSILFLFTRWTNTTITAFPKRIWMHSKEALTLLTNPLYYSFHLDRKIVNSNR
jgi:hypothetical protein